MLVKEGNYYQFVSKLARLFIVQIVNQLLAYLLTFSYCLKCRLFTGNLKLKSSYMLS